MRETVFKKALSLLLCAVLILGVLPLDSHAAGYQVNGQSITWYFPLPEEFFDDIEDFAGCRGANENSLYGTPNLGCTHADHAELPYGSEAMIVNVSDTQPVYAPADGTLYRSSQPDSQWGDVAVIEATVDSDFSIYILMGSVSPDGVTASGSYVPSGSVIGYTSGIFRLGALMDFAGMGAQVAENLAGELSVVQSKGWLSEGVNTGLVCVNPSASTATGYPNSLVYDHSGPILYEFVPGQPVTEPSTEPPTEAPTEAPHTEHSWDGGTVTVPATHTSEGSIHYTCTICGAGRDEAIPADVNAHVFDQQVASDAYLVAPANCAGGAQYRYSCVCGAAGEATFVSGDATGAHVWDDGTVTVPATHTSEGSIHYTCTICGAGRDEAIPASADHVFDQEVVDDKYLASPATCSNAATYFKSCICGEKGSETFPYGNPAPHTYSDQWSFNETDHWRAATCGHNGETTDFGPHKWDDGKIIKDAGHNVNGEKLYTCTTCGTTKTETIAGQPHEYNQMVISDQYLASPATCTSPATYYFACVCGEKGSEVFSYGEAKGHTYSDRWSSNELQHWHAATCEHTGEKADAADHVWNPGQITTQPTATSKGVMTYTCSICGATKTEDVEPTQHEHTFAATWAGNTTYHWHPATCEHTNVVSGLGEHIWNQGVVTSVASHSAAGQKQYTCTVCGIQKTETVPQTHTYDQQIASSAYLASNATCTSPATYYYSCSCGAKDTTRTFTSGSALGHVASGTWGKDANYHWYVCSRCGARGELNAHTLNTSGTCTVCGYSKEESHIHSSHLSRVPAKAATCTQEGNSAYYICDCGKWFSDVTTTSEITDQKSVVIPALGHVDKDNNGRCDLCKERLDNTVEYQITEGKDSTWLNTSSQGLVIRSNAAYSQFDRVEVDGATVAVTNYSVSEGSTIVELNASYLRRLSLGYHTISIVAKDGKATTGFTIKQGAATSGGSSNGIWGMILFLAVVIAIAIPVTYGVYYYRKKTGNGRYS